MSGPLWMQLLAVAVGGAVGGALRHLLSTGVARIAGDTFPWGTLVVNLSGAFALGVLLGTLPPHGMAGGYVWLLFGIGVLGSYTTVSSLSLQSLQLAQARAFRSLAAYLLLSVLLGVGACLLGIFVAGRW